MREAYDWVRDIYYYNQLIMFVNYFLGFNVMYKSVQFKLGKRVYIMIVFIVCVLVLVKFEC